jgi:hypothetical protein
MAASTTAAETGVDRRFAVTRTLGIGPHWHGSDTSSGSDFEVPPLSCVESRR